MTDDKTAFLSRRRRIRRVMNLMVRHARQERYGDITPLSLTELAYEACCSKEHLVRIWKKVFHEPPVATARRIRLDLSVQLMLKGAPVSQAAEQAGFSSVQAFGHAFRRQFEASATQLLKSRRMVRRNAPDLKIVQIREPVDCFGIPYTGLEGNGLDSTFDMTLDKLVRGGSNRREWRVLGLWSVPPESEGPAARPVEMASAVVACNLRVPVRNLSHITVPAGYYLRLDGVRLSSERKLDERLLAAGWKRSHGPAIQDFATDPARTIPSKRRNHLLVPIVPMRSGLASPVSELCLLPPSWPSPLLDCAVLSSINRVGDM